MTRLRPFEKSDWPAIWRIIEPVFRAGETYSFDRNISEDEAFRAWITAPAATFVAEGDAGTILGTYYIKPNQPGQGAHVCNCGYIVSETARGMGIASEMCLHSQTEALTLGFLAMQYNLVVATNTGAARLWQKLGFEIAGTLPRAFHHPSQGLVDAFVMYKWLNSASI